MINNWEIILAIVIVGLSVVMPIFYSYQKKLKQRKIEEQIKEAKYVTEKEKIRVYLDQINERTRSKYR
tara:strand:+ start:873 stop:1076 length:204 start_codon:yes stop_codon:yes gene_type:complete